MPLTGLSPITNNNMKQALTSLALRVKAKDIFAIYTLALVDLALLSALIATIAFFI